MEVKVILMSSLGAPEIDSVLTDEQKIEVDAIREKLKEQFEAD
jgi:hypothetical protein